MASANPFNVQRAVQALPRPHRSPSMGDAVRAMIGRPLAWQRVRPSLRRHWNET